jgi:hypothetical protein
LLLTRTDRLRGSILEAATQPTMSGSGVRASRGSAGCCISREATVRRECHQALRRCDNFCRRRCAALGSTRRPAHNFEPHERPERDVGLVLVFALAARDCCQESRGFRSPRVGWPPASWSKRPRVIGHAGASGSRVVARSFVDDRADPGHGIGSAPRGERRRRQSAARRRQACRARCVGQRAASSARNLA